MNGPRLFRSTFCVHHAFSFGERERVPGEARELLQNDLKSTVWEIRNPTHHLDHHRQPGTSLLLSPRGVPQGSPPSPRNKTQERRSACPDDSAVWWSYGGELFLMSEVPL